MTRVAVIGVGSMGKNHVRVYQEMPEAELVAVSDVNTSALDSLKRMYRLKSYTNYKKMVEKEKPEAVSVVVPTQAHFPVVQWLLQAGCHVLVEKPITATLDEAQELIRLADRTQRLLMVGHIERYNPAIIELKRRLSVNELGRVIQIHARRLGPFPPRILDVGVIMDLATHDLDIMRYLTGSEATRVYAETQRELHTLHEDLFNGMVRFDNGTIGMLEINWLTPTKIRELFITGERGMFRANYLTQDLFFFENAEALSAQRGVTEGAMIQYKINKKEPLRAELEAFVGFVRNGSVLVGNGEASRAALALALAMVESATTNQVKELSPNGNYKSPGGYVIPANRGIAATTLPLPQASG